MALEDAVQSERRTRIVIDEKTLEQIRKRNNPDNKPAGHYTGRCKECYSTNLWDDNTHYGCGDCGAVYIC